MDEDRQYYSYEYIHKQTCILISLIEQSGIKFDYVAAVSRGGLIPGVTVSHHLGLPLVPIQWSTRDHSQQVHQSIVMEDLHAGSTVLLVDDINDSGRTFIELIDDWSYNDQCEGKLVTASLFQRYSTQCPSDFYSRLIQSDSWVVFPWEKY